MRPWSSAHRLNDWNNFALEFAVRSFQGILSISKAVWLGAPQPWSCLITQRCCCWWWWCWWWRGKEQISKFAPGPYNCISLPPPAWRMSDICPQRSDFSRWKSSHQQPLWAVFPLCWNVCVASVGLVGWAWLSYDLKFHTEKWISHQYLVV